MVQQLINDLLRGRPRLPASLLRVESAIIFLELMEDPHDR